MNISNFKNERDFLNSSNTTLVITRGQNGSDIFRNESGEVTKIHIDAVKPKSEIIDPTGAGDCYKAGFLASYLKGYSYEKCGMIGAYLGSACVTQRGGILPQNIINEVRLKFLS